MQRQGFSQPPAHSPPLHHPVPQHISQVPNMRSPPPPAPQSTGPQGQYGGYGGQQQQAPPQQQQGFMGGIPGIGGAGQFGGFINESTATMGVQMAEKYMDQQFSRYVNVSALKNLFNVSNSYVINKLIIILVPWRHKPWARKQISGFGGSEQIQYAPPREDLNSPDAYVGAMALVSYVLLSTLLAGLRGSFDPALLSSILSWAVFVVFLEIAILNLFKYFLSINSVSSLLDLLCYAGYKFVHINITILMSEIWNRGGGTGGWFGWAVFLYFYNANSYFLLRSLRYFMLPTEQNSSGVGGFGAAGRSERQMKQSRTYALAGYAYVAQFFFMYVLTRNI